MITEIKMYGCKCDNCGAEWSWVGGELITKTQPNEVARCVKIEGWSIRGEKHYCKNC